MASSVGEISAELVASLVREQHPDLSDRAVTFGASGWDNQLWRLGDDLAVRLPWATRDADELLLKEFEVLPGVVAGLPLPVPVPQRLGRPSTTFPRPWMVTTWVPGDPADRAWITKGEESAATLASFLSALHSPAPVGAPEGRHRRGGPLAQVNDGFSYFLEQSVERGLIVDTQAVRAVWGDALAADLWDGPDVWLHADLHPANLLTENGALCGVVDFGDVCAGDPACDVASGWLLPGDALNRFHRDYVHSDDATLRRARGWALLKALACAIIGDNGDKGLPGGKPTWLAPSMEALRRLQASVDVRLVPDQQDAPKAR